MLQLEPNVEYRASAFDPTSGETIALPSVKAGNEAGSTIAKPEAIESDDWVIVLERAE